MDSVDEATRMASIALPATRCAESCTVGRPLNNFADGAPSVAAVAVDDELVNAALQAALASNGPAEPSAVAPEQLPDHPANADPASGFATSAIVVPVVNTALQIVPHDIPDGVDSMIPVPLPVLVMLRLFCVTGQDCECACVDAQVTRKIVARISLSQIEFCTWTPLGTLKLHPYFYITPPTTSAP
jgi:hypothetical protein